MSRKKPRGLPRIAIVSMYFEPETTGSAPYITDTARHLAAQGRVVHVFTTWPHYPAWRTRRVGAVGELPDVPNLVVHRIPTYVPRNPTPVKRLLYEFLFASLACLALLRAGRFNLYIGCSPNLFSAVVARVAGRISRRPAMVLVQDIVSSAPSQTAQLAFPGITKLLRKFEGWALRGSDRVIIPTEGFGTALGRLGVDPDRVRVIRNWTHLDAPRTLPAPRDGLVLHTGNIGQKQGLDFLAPALRLAVAHDERLRFLFVGDGNRRRELAAAVLDIPRVQLEQPVSASEYMDLLTSAEVLLVHERPGVIDMSLPSKLTSYFAAGRPIVAIVDPSGVTAREVLMSGAGLVVGHDELGRLPAVLTSLIDDDQLALAMGKKGQDHCQTYLSPGAGLSAINHVVDDLLVSACTTDSIAR